MVKEPNAVNEAANLEGEFILGKLTLSLEDYLALEPGDEIEITSNPVLSGVLRIDGLSIASGTVTLEEGKIILKMNNLSQRGNIS